MTYWPYNLALSTKWYDFAEFEPNGWGPYLTSLKMSALVAVLGTALIFAGAYLIEKGEGLAPARRSRICWR